MPSISAFIPRALSPLAVTPTGHNAPAAAETAARIGSLEDISCASQSAVQDGKSVKGESALVPVTRNNITFFVTCAPQDDVATLKQALDPFLVRVVVGRADQQPDLAW